MSTKEKIQRTRNWTVIVYPDSAPENWRDIINEYHIEWIESPLHDKDINATGEPKKPHYHILLLFQGVKTYEQILSLIEPLNCTIPMICQSTKALVRYFAHLDNPDKQQYKISDIKAHGGVELDDLLKPTASERSNILKEIFIFIADNHITEFKDLVDYCIKENIEWYYTIVNTSTYILIQYIRSQRHSRKERINKETGEIMVDN
jgi:hypothetical protein